MPEIACLGLPPPPSDDQPDRARTFRRELQTARRDHWQTYQFGDHGCEPAEPQGFLESFENVFLSDRFHIDDAIGMETHLGQRRGEKVGTRQAPDDLAFGPSRDTGHKERSCGPINSPCSASCKLVDRAVG